MPSAGAVATLAIYLPIHLADEILCLVEERRIRRTAHRALMDVDAESIEEIQWGLKKALVRATKGHQPDELELYCLVSCMYCILLLASTR
jgi:hypothetical protein